MKQHLQFTIDTNVQVYFCDPHSPWQRALAENTNGLLRQYFPKNRSVAGYSQEDLDRVAEQLNGRPRETLAWLNPAEKLAAILEESSGAGVASPPGTCPAVGPLRRQRVVKSPANVPIALHADSTRISDVVKSQDAADLCQHDFRHGHRVAVRACQRVDGAETGQRHHSLQGGLQPP